MFCPLCGFEVHEGQKFCPECAHDLRGVTDATKPLVITPADVDNDEYLPSLSDLPTREIRVRDEIPDPHWATPTGDTPTVAPDAAPTAAPIGFEPPTPAHPSQLVTPDDRFGPTETPIGGMSAARPPVDPYAGATTQMEATQVEAVGAPLTTGEIPALFDGSDDLAEFPPPREPFKLKVVFLLAFFGAVAVLMSAAADVIDIRTSTPVDGIATGVRTIDTLGTNLAVAGFVGGSVMALGGLLACFGFRWGAGLAGGAGLALVGWSGLVVGLAELRVANAESITRRTTDIAFTLKITRDLGFWLIVAAGAIGFLVFVASLRSIGTGGRAPLNPWIAALGAVAGVVLVAGPLLPEGNATFANNYRSPSQLLDLPSVYFAGRLGQLGLIAFTVVFGMLIVRAYGLGLAAGGVSVALWLWISSLVEMGNFPLGIAAGNFGASDSIPHAVTTVGMALTILMLIVAATLAIIGSTRPRYRP